MDRDRSLEPGPQNDLEEPLSNVPSAPFEHYKGLTGVKLPKFHGKYTEDVNAWLAVIEDQFYLNRTAEAVKVPAVSPLLQSDALTWYLWLRKEYHRTPTWMEFKKELRVKFANSTVRTSALRDKLQFIAFEGPQYMEQYISQFRTLEVQIPSEEMAFGDRLHYFIRPLPLKCQRTIKLEHPRSMETVYDAAIDWAYVNGDGKQQKSIFDSIDRAKSLIETAQQILDNGKRIGEFSDDVTDEAQGYRI
jgi:hypothetical protein